MYHFVQGRGALLCAYTDKLIVCVPRHSSLRFTHLNEDDTVGFLFFGFVCLFILNSKGKTAICAGVAGFFPIFQFQKKIAHFRTNNFIITDC